MKKAILFENGFDIISLCHPHAESALLSNEIFDLIKYIMGVFELTKIAQILISGIQIWIIFYKYVYYLYNYTYTILPCFP
jgi:hypothetical protein